MKSKESPANRGGLSLLEVSISMLLSAVILTASLNTLGAAKRRESSAFDRSIEYALANDLLQEILRLPYADPDQTPLFGLENSESSGDRLRYDDVDDYEGLIETPPKNRSGVELTDYTGLTRQVNVQWIAAASPHAPIGFNDGLKQITVTVRRGSESLAQMKGYRSDGYRSEIKP